MLEIRSPYPVVYDGHTPKGESQVSLSSRIAISLALILFAVGYRLHKQDAEIAALKKGAAGVESAGAFGSPGTLQQQEACSRQADLAYKQAGYKPNDLSSYENHFNSKLGRCLVVMHSKLSSGSTLTLSTSLSDAFEGRSFASYIAVTSAARPAECYVYSASGEEVQCSSSNQFQQMMAHYMRE